MQAYRRTNRQTFSSETSSERDRVEGFELRPDLERLRMMQVGQDRQRLCADQAGRAEVIGGHVGVAEVGERHREVEAAAHLPLERDGTQEAGGRLGVEAEALPDEAQGVPGAGPPGGVADRLAQLDGLRAVRAGLAELPEVRVVPGGPVQRAGPDELHVRVVW